MIKTALKLKRSEPNHNLDHCYGNVQAITSTQKKVGFDHIKAFTFKLIKKM